VAQFPAFPGATDVSPVKQLFQSLIDGYFVEPRPFQDFLESRIAHALPPVERLPQDHGDLGIGIPYFLVGVDLDDELLVFF
jgi:hypothetical protein